MADRVISAEAIITGKDLTGDMFGQIARKTQGVGKNISSISPHIDAMSKSLLKANEQLKALDKMQASQRGLADARQRFNAAKEAVTAAARAMQAAQGPTKQLSANYMAAQRAVSQASAAFQKQATAAKAAKVALEGFGAPTSKVAAEQARLKNVIDATTKSIERQAAMEKKALHAVGNAVRQPVGVLPRADAHLQSRGSGHGHKRSFIGGIGHEVGHVTGFTGLAAGYGVVRAGERTLETYRDFDKERRYAKAVMGITDEQQEPLIKQAIHGGATSKFNDIQWLEAQRELAARGLNRNQVMALTDVASTIGQAMDKTLPEAAKALEGGMFGFGKDTSTFEKARANAMRTADLQVKASKISGMNYEDLIGAYKYAATPFRMAGLTEEQMLAFAAVGKKANMGGDEMGTAGRALVANLLKPTAGARTAMMAAGIDFSKYQKVGEKLMNADDFARNISAKYGANLNGTAKAALQAVFNDKAIVADAAKFTPKIMSLLGEHLGAKDAKSKKSIAGEANRFRDASMAGVDTQSLFRDLMVAMTKSPSLANAVFGSKQGGRIMTGTDEHSFLEKLDELVNHSTGYAKKVSTERMAGFDGAVSKFLNSIKNLETSLGRAADNNGKGGLLTNLTNLAGGGIQHLAEAHPDFLKKMMGVGGAGLAYAGYRGAQGMMGGFGLGKSAVALDGAAAALTRAAGVLGTKGAMGSGGGLPGGGPGGKNSLPGRAMMGLFSAAALFGDDLWTDMFGTDAEKKAAEERRTKNADWMKRKGQQGGDAIRKLLPPWLQKFLRFSDDNQPRGELEGDGHAVAGGMKLLPPRDPNANPYGSMQRVPMGPLTEDQMRLRDDAERVGKPFDALKRAMAEHERAEAAKRIYENVPLPPMRSQAFPAPQVDTSYGPQMPAPLRGGQGGPVDVTGKIQAEVTSEVTSHVDAKVQVDVKAGDGLIANVVNQVIKAIPGASTSKGTSMPGALNPSPTAFGM